MKISLLFLALSSLLPIHLPAAQTSQPKVESGSFEEKADTLNWVVAPNPQLPNVLILGDSISIGYTLKVREMLSGVANVYRPTDTPMRGTIPRPENCFSTKFALEPYDTIFPHSKPDPGISTKNMSCIEKWLGNTKWQVIHFNFGMHDFKYLDANGKITDHAKGTIAVPLGEYEANLRKIVAILQKTGAQLIWASSTPVPPNTNGGRVEGGEIPYNQIAEKIMKENNIPIDDLHGVIAPHGVTLSLKPDNVHFKDEGYQLLAQSVTQSILHALHTKSSN